MKKKLILLLVIILFTFFTYFTYSIYKKNTSGTVSVGTASFSVSMSGNENDVSIIENNTIFSETVTVTNNSEVDVIYSIIVSDLPTGMQISLDNGNYVSETNNQIVFTNVGTALYGSSPISHILKFNAPLTVAEVNNQSVNVNVEFKQVLN